MRPIEARLQMRLCNSPTAVRMRTYYAHYVQHPRGPDQGLPLWQEGNPYQITKERQSSRMMRPPSWYNEEWATRLYWCEEFPHPPTPIGSPRFWDQQWAASGARTDFAARKKDTSLGFGPIRFLQNVDSTQGVHVDSFHGSDSEYAPKDVTPKDGSDSEYAPIKKDLRGGISLLYMATAHFFARRRGLTRTHRSP